jgi:hypothetical protein
VPSSYPFSTGLAGLDEVLTGLRPGDNVVWQVDSVDEYVPFVHHFCTEATRRRQPLVYFRFASHEPLLPAGAKADVYQLHPDRGFEDFISEIFDVVERVGVGGCYVFDCLSDLAVDWCSDRMLGSFFLLTCPYLYDYETVAYFALLRDRHTRKATDSVHGTAQVVIDAYRSNGRLYVHPLKVYKRHSETMHMLHGWQGEQFVPVTQSATITEILSSAPQPWLDFTIQRADVWTRAFREAADLVDAARAGQRDAEKERQSFRKLLSMAVTRDQRLAALAEQYLELSDLVEIGKRMIGTGQIGGKAVGMLLARAILRKSRPRWAERLEPHDSFYIGSDVFYTYLIQNDAWWGRRSLKDFEAGLEMAREARHRLLRGHFPADLQEQCVQMLDYFGQSPIIVRSSSLLEDAYGNAFSGKYESVFCPNQGTRADRLHAFMDAVRSVYASTTSREALTYRARRRLLDREEQMALLVQRVSGQRYGSYFYPQAAGAGFSFNPFVWNSAIDPKAGFLRLVFGLGTRAVERSDDDYTRIVALNAPLRLPVAHPEEARKYAQRRVDVLDLRDNRHVSLPFEQVAQGSPDLPLHIFAARDHALAKLASEPGSHHVFPWVLQFEELLGHTEFVSDMREMMATLEAAYQHPVDVEFTANFVDQRNYRINIVQCRPFQVRGRPGSVELPRSVAEERVVLRTSGPIIGHSRVTPVDRIVYVMPQTYGVLPMQDRVAVARLVGRITHLGGAAAAETILLVGPGRWGTTTPALGVPVTITEIDTVSVLCEIAEMHPGLVPNVSLGTHFFNDIVELDMLYLAVDPREQGSMIQSELLASAPNALAELLPGNEALSEVVRVIEIGKRPGWKRCWLRVDAMEQRGICFLEDE